MLLKLYTVEPTNPSIVNFYYIYLKQEIFRCVLKTILTEIYIQIRSTVCALLILRLIP